MADRILRARAKVPNPYLFQEQGATLQSLKKWFNVVCNHQKQNDEFLIFFDGEEHEEWTAKNIDNHRGIQVQPRAAVNAVAAADGVEEVAAVEEITAAQAAQLSRVMRRDLDTLSNTFATYAPEAFYDTIIEELIGGSYRDIPLCTVTLCIGIEKCYEIYDLIKRTYSKPF